MFSKTASSFVTSFNAGNNNNASVANSISASDQLSAFA